MSQRSTFNLALALIVAGAMLGLSFLFVGQPAEAAPPAAPTPVTNLVASDKANYFEVLDRAVTADSYYQAPSSLASFEWADWQYAIDQGSSVNTTTLTLEYSNDGANWTTGPNLVATNAADADDLVRLPLFGRYTRVYANVTNSNAVTISVNLLAK